MIKLGQSVELVNFTGGLTKWNGAICIVVKEQEYKRVGAVLKPRIGVRAVKIGTTLIVSPHNLIAVDDGGSRTIANWDTCPFQPERDHE